MSSNLDLLIDQNALPHRIEKMKDKIHFNKLVGSTLMQNKQASWVYFLYEYIHQ